MAVSVAAEESSQATTTDHLRLWDGQRHQRFMDAMDSLPEDCTELEWIMRLAEKLQWEPGEVALHAFRYFLALNEYYLQEERDEAYREGNKKPSNQWTEEEAILFDTLCAVYMQESTGPPNERDWYWVVQISSFFPGRSPDYLWEKYKGIRGSVMENTGRRSQGHANVRFVIEHEL